MRGVCACFFFWGEREGVRGVCLGLYKNTAAELFGQAFEAQHCSSAYQYCKFRGLAANRTLYIEQVRKTSP